MAKKNAPPPGVAALAAAVGKGDRHTPPLALEAIMPRTIRACGLTLRPFTLTHLAALDLLESPMMRGAPLTHYDAMVGLYVASLGAEELARMLAGPRDAFLAAACQLGEQIAPSASPEAMRAISDLVTQAFSTAIPAADPTTAGPAPA